jgi:enterochelin esterase family protein
MISQKPDTTPGRILLGEMATLVDRIEKAPADTRAGLVDAFLKDKGPMPLIEAPDLVHFVHRGEASDVAVSGNFLDWDEEIPLHRIEGTDLHVRSHRLDPEGCYEYALRVDFGEPLPDPGNPETMFTLFGVFSLLQMPEFDAPDLQAVPENDRGRLVEMTLDSKALEAEKKIQVYLPRGYDDEGERRYPLLVVTHGDLAVENGKMDRILDHAILEGRVAEVVVAFVSGDFEEYGGSKTEAHARMLTEELLPHLDHHHRLVPGPAARGILGLLDGASMAVYTTFKFPGTFGKVATQSPFLNKLVLGEITKLVKESKIEDLDCVIERRRTDLYLEGGSISAKADSDLLVRILTEKGFRVSSPEVAGSWSMASWRSRFDEILAAFFPAPGAR